MHPDASSTLTKDGIIVNQILNSSLEGDYNPDHEKKRHDVVAFGYYVINELRRQNIHTKVEQQEFGKFIGTVLKVHYTTDTRRNDEQEECINMRINTLVTKRLKKPIDIIIEYDEEYYIARSLDLPLYACGEDKFEAIQNIKHELENVYFELLEDENFSDEWLNYKNFLKSIIID